MNKRVGPLVFAGAAVLGSCASSGNSSFPSLKSGVEYSDHELTMTLYNVQGTCNLFRGDSIELGDDAMATVVDATPRSSAEDVAKATALDKPSILEAQRTAARLIIDKAKACAAGEKLLIGPRPGDTNPFSNNGAATNAAAFLAFNYYYRAEFEAQEIITKHTPAAQYIDVAAEFGATALTDTSNESSGRYAPAYEQCSVVAGRQILIQGITTEGLTVGLLQSNGQPDAMAALCGNNAEILF